MIRHRWTVWLFVWVGGVLAGVPGRAQDVRARLQAAWQAFKEARFEDTLRLAQVVLKSTDLHEATRIEALALQAYASVALGRLSTAEERFRAILQIQPDWTPPGDVASPRILRVFEQARQTSEAERALERALWTSLLVRWTEAVRRDDWVEAYEVWRQVEQTTWRHPEVRRQVKTLGSVWNPAWNELTHFQRALRDMVLVPATPAASIGVGPTSRQVTLQAFYMDAFPVTWERYAAVARARGQTVTYPPDRARHPVVQVTWDEAQTF
ncbi:MAG: SUMF1/EgtB/PvdO family nonheme iron enzyme, partial [Acidobacteria bacterium]|nr:SUMF1/EgtB/PvdO family nonheme iron enzyme [Acidobacteriota bacterium]MDW7984108.1 SUMF1/EgtB/PvdO family nonheme iron enzyme [Acidobacteriota bacterium]